MSVVGILFYVLLGGLMALAAFCVYNFHRRTPLEWQSWAYAVAAILLVPFGLAWAFMSMLEGEPQAAVMGVVMFSGTGVFFGFLSWWRARPAATDNEQKSEGPTSHRAAVTSGKLAAIVLLVLFVLSLPVSLFVMNVGENLFSPKKIGELVVDNIVSDTALPKSIKKAVVAQVRHGAEGFTLEQRLMLSMTGSVDEREWVALLDLVMPQKKRVALTQHATGAFFAWLDSEQAYPELVIPTGEYAAAFMSHAEEVVPWIYDSMLFPGCSEEQEARYARGDFGSDLMSLIGCRPAAESRAQLIPHAAELLRKEIQSQDISQTVSLSEELSKAQLTPEKMDLQKKKINTLRTVTHAIWLLPLLLLVGALACAVRSRKALVIWLRWPLLSAGLLGLLLMRFFLSPTGFMSQALSIPPADTPAAAFAISKKFLMALFMRAGDALFVQMSVAIMVGVVLLLLLLVSNRRKKIG
jgi:hypothetical protein